jgi:bifunctional enzyme CysN/CysC
VIFSPSNKASTIASVEAFHAPATTEVSAGRAAGITLTEQIYVSRGEIMSHLDRAPGVSTRLRANLFWLGRKPMVPGKRYKLKLATAETEVTIDSIARVLDASELEASIDKQQIDRHDVADLVLRTRHPIAFDPATELEATGRFVIVDEYDIAGGGIVRALVGDDQEQRRLESRIRNREWVRGDITAADRAEHSGHVASMVMITGEANMGKRPVARALEARLARDLHRAYLLDGKNLVLGVDADIAFDDIDELVRRFGEVAYILLDAGNLVISTTNLIGLSDHARIVSQIAPFQTLVVHMGKEAEGLPEGADLLLEPHTDPAEACARILAELRRHGRLRPPT